jgi:serine protease Do
MVEHSSSSSRAGMIIVSSVVGAVASAIVVLAWQPLEGLVEKRYQLHSERAKENQAQVLEGFRGLQDEEAATIHVVQSANVSVVSIGVFQDEAKIISRGTGSLPFIDQLLRERVIIPTTPSKKKVQISGGTGFVISTDGMILTNRHVVDEENLEYRVTLANGKTYTARVVGKDTIHDVAIIHIDAPDLKPVVIGDSDTVVIGQTVLAIGNAFSEFDNSVTRGIISGVNRRVYAGDALGSSEIIEEALQTDAAINPGNSGGPLINLRGEVIGMNTAVSQQGQSVGFAIPINVAKRSMESVRKHGRIVRTWLGVRYVTITPELQEMNNLSVTNGALIPSDSKSVIEGSPAAKAGLKPGDIITQVQGIPLTEKVSLPRALSAHWPGDVISITLSRGAKQIETKVTLGELPNE